MKKSFKILSAIILSSTMAFGVGATIFASANKTLKVAEAATHTANYDSYTYSGTYYSSITSSLTEGTSGTLRTTLTNLICPTSWYTYSGDGTGTLSEQLQEADEDPTNSSNMVLLYTRNSITKCVSNGAANWNREHVWPQSLSSTSSSNNWGTTKAGTDLLHLRPTYSTPNSTRGNLKYGNVSSSTVKTYNNMEYGYASSSYFMPLDSVKGDVARICMYVWVAYKNTYSNFPELTGVFESFDTLMSWHCSDKPDVMEGNRNDYVQTTKQGNRNPFVDHPEYAWKIFGSQCSSSVLATAKSTYPESGSSGSSTSTDPSATITGSSSVTAGSTISLSASLSNVSNASNITWESSNESVATVTKGTTTTSSSAATVTGVAAGSATIYCKHSGTTIGQKTITVNSSGGTSSGDTSSTYTKLTSVSNIDSTAQYVLGVEGTGFHYSGTSSWGLVDLPTSQTPLYYTLTISGSYFTAKTTIDSTTYYLTVPTSNTFTMSTSSTQIKLGTTTSDSSGDADYAIANTSTTTRHLRINGSSGLRSYAGTTGTMAYFYKVNQNTSATLSSINVKTAPTKTTYSVGEYFDPTGLTLNLVYSDTSYNTTVAYSTSNASDFTFNPTTSTALTTSHTSVDIAYGGKSCTQVITVTSSGSSSNTPNSSYTFSSNTTTYSNNPSFSSVTNNWDSNVFTVSSQSNIRVGSSGNSSSAFSTSDYMFYPSSGSSASITIALNNSDYIVSKVSISACKNLSTEAPTMSCGNISKTVTDLTPKGTYNYYPLDSQFTIEVSSYRVFISTITLTIISSSNEHLGWGTSFLEMTATECAAGSGISSDTWSDCTTIFNNNVDSNTQVDILGYTANASGDACAEAVARYDNIIANYNLTDFAARGNGANRMNIFQGKSANNILLILGSISLLGGLTYLAYFLKKRKED